MMRAGDVGMMTAITDDDAALAAAACHDRQEFAQLYDRYVARIERYILARTWNPSEVEDLVGETFLRAMSKIHTYRRERGTFAAWLFTIARNVAADHERAGRRLVGRDPLERVDAGPGPEGIALRRERVAAVEAALATLTPEQRDAVALRYAAELPFADIGRTLGKSEAAAKMLVQRGLQGLRHQLKETKE